MEMTLGDPGIDWGSVADWISVLVNVFVGVSVFWLSHRTYQLTQQATRRDDLAQIESRAQQEREGRLLLVLFRAEIVIYRAELQKVAHYLSPEGGVEKFVAGTGRDLVETVTQLKLDTVSGKEGRIHVLPDDQAVVFVRLIGGLAALRELVSIARRSSVDNRGELTQRLLVFVEKTIALAKSAEVHCSAAQKSFYADGGAG